MFCGTPCKWLLSNKENIIGHHSRYLINIYTTWLLYIDGSIDQCCRQKALDGWGGWGAPGLGVRLGINIICLACACSVNLEHKYKWYKTNWGIQRSLESFSSSEPLNIEPGIISASSSSSLFIEPWNPNFGVILSHKQKYSQQTVYYQSKQIILVPWCAAGGAKMNVVV